MSEALKRLRDILTWLSLPLLAAAVGLSCFLLDHPALIALLGLASGAGFMALFFINPPTAGWARRSSIPVDKISVRTFYVLDFATLAIAAWLLHDGWDRYRNPHFPPHIQAGMLFLPALLIGAAVVAYPIIRRIKPS